ncbi:MAG: HDIG domain-containing metalloprotein [Elainellaceae cyanobacterium]
MKPFRSLTQQLDQWWRSRSAIGSKTPPDDSGRKLISSTSASQSQEDIPHPETTVVPPNQPWKRFTDLKSSVKSGLLTTESHIFTRPVSPRRKVKKYKKSSPIVFVIALASLTSSIGYRLYNSPKLDVDTLAPQTIRANETRVVEDTKTTQEQREAASRGSIPILMVDKTVNQRIYQDIQRVFDDADKVREQAGVFPFVDTSILSETSQRYLRQVTDTEWNEILAIAEGRAVPSAEPAEPAELAEPDDQSGESPGESPGGSSSAAPASSEAAAPASSGDASSTQAQDALLTTDSSPASNGDRQLAIAELQTHQRTASTDDFAVVKQVIIRARERYDFTLASSGAMLRSESSSIQPVALLNLSDTEWQQAKASIRLALEGMLTQGIPNGLPESLIRASAGYQLEATDIPNRAIVLAEDLLTRTTKPNLVEDPEQTRLFAEQAAQAVKPEMVEIRRGEIIVEAGEKITQSQFVLLDEFGMSRRGIDWVGLVGFAGFVGGSIFFLLLVERWFRPGLRRRDHALLLLLALSTPLLVITPLPSTNLPAVGLLVGSFYGSALGLTIVGFLGIALPIGGISIGMAPLLSSLSGGLVGTIMAGRLRSREELALLGGVVGVVQGVVYLIVTLMLSAAVTPVWYALLMDALIHALVGVAWSVVALGVSPYLEHVFDLVTPIRLVELSNPNRPLLKKLASKAPGTFQHTLFVASLAEAAAREMGCNVELVRAGTLYHDIGKMHDPEGFIENQMGAPNKHDAIDDPWKSAEIIRKHVTEGIVMAKRCRLPRAIQAFIPEHQGTMLITYFYYQAQQRAKEDATVVLNEGIFRYAGPTPQSRETGIVMLADSCEAALRSLKDATHEEALAMVNRILRARWQDDQLVDSGLTRQDMTRIAEIFVRVWQQYNHKRIPYPKAAFAPPSPSPVS